MTEDHLVWLVVAVLRRQPVGLGERRQALRRTVPQALPQTQFHLTGTHTLRATEGSYLLRALMIGCSHPSHSSPAGWGD